MSAFYDNLAATADSLIERFGEERVIRRTVSTFDPITGAMSAPVVTTGSIVAVNLPASKGTIEAFDDRLFEGISIAKIRFFLAAALSASFVPQGTDEIVLDGEYYTILGVTPLKPASTALTYKLAAMRK